MINTLIITSKERANAEKPVIGEDKYLATPQLSINISKKEQGIVIKIKKLFIK